MKEAVDSCKKNFSRTRNSWRIFSIDGLSQMTPILDNSLVSEKRQTFWNDKMRSHERLNFYLKTQPIKCFFPFSYSKTYCFELYSSFYDTLTKCVARVISDWTVLEVQTQERRSLEQTNQWLAPTFQWKQRCNYERMRHKDVKFIHFI